MNYYEHHLGDYMRDTAHLSMLEDGAYRRLIDAYYIAEEPFPDDKREVLKIARATTKAEKDAVEYVLRKFFVYEAGSGWLHKRCNAEIARYQDKQRKARASAAVSVQVRQEKAALSNAQIRSERMAAARAKGTHTREQWIALRHVCGYRCVKCQDDGHQDRDHILPVYRGGSDAIENIQPLCARCNAAKGPESLDYRPNDWAASVQRTLNERPAEFERTLNGRSTDVQHRAPVPSHQSPDKEISPSAHPKPAARGGSVHRFPPGFETLWAEYPRKVGKDAAARAFAKRRPDSALLSAMVAAVRAQRASEQWTRDGGQFVPHLSTWLNGGRWQDELPVISNAMDAVFGAAH